MEVTISLDGGREANAQTARVAVLLHTQTKSTTGLLWSGVDAIASSRKGIT